MSGESFERRAPVNLNDHQVAINKLAEDGGGGSAFDREAPKRWPNMANDPKQVLEYRLARAQLLKDAERYPEALDELTKAADAARLTGDPTLEKRVVDEQQAFG